MILKYYEFGKINTENSKFILLYGKNEGLKNEKISELILKKKNSKIFKYDEKEILENKENFYNNILTGSLFERSKIIIINRSTDKLLSIINPLFNKLIEDIIFIINSDILEKKSKLRSSFEKEKNLTCIAFYPDTNETLIKLAQNFFNNIKIKISSQNINLIINKCNGDRKYLKNELEKIFFFVKNKKKIETKDLIKLINLTENFSVNELIDTCLSKNKKKTIYILNENNFSSEDSIVIIRTFLSKAKRILHLLNDYQINNDINKTIMGAKPPIFWKDKEIVKQQIRSWKPEKIKEIIYKLCELELTVKKISSNSINMITDFILEKSSSNASN